MPYIRLVNSITKVITNWTYLPTIITVAQWARQSGDSPNTGSTRKILPWWKIKKDNHWKYLVNTMAENKAIVTMDMPVTNHVCTLQE